MKPKRPNQGQPTNSPRHMIIKLSKIMDKERILKTVTQKGSPIGLSVDFPAKTFQVRRQCDDIFQVLKGKRCQTRILYLTKLLLKNEGGRKKCRIGKVFPRHKLRELVITGPALPKRLKRVLQIKTLNSAMDGI